LNRSCEFSSFFGPVRIRASPTGVASSLSPPRYRLSSSRCCHTAVSCHISFPLSQDELATSASSRRLSSRAETGALNSHHRRRPPSPDHPTHTLHYYKNVISILTTLPTTQSHLYFASSQAGASRHRSSTCHCRFFSPSSHAHRPSAQRYLQ
jgi:hypothetical protein